MPAGKVPPLWPGRTVFVVASGPSNLLVDLRRLDGRPTIAVNRMYEQLPRAGICYWSDLRFWHWHKKGLLEHPGLKFSCDSHCRHDEVTTLAKMGMTGLCENPAGVAHGNNSGYAAINVAFHTLARRIVLLGFDMRLGPNGEQHCHPDHPVSLRETVFPKMLPWFPSIVQPLTDRGVEVLNASEGSALECFPKIPVEQALALPD